MVASCGQMLRLLFVCLPQCLNAASNRNSSSGNAEKSSVQNSQTLPRRLAAGYCIKHTNIVWLHDVAAAAAGRQTNKAAMLPKSEKSEADLRYQMPSPTSEDRIGNLDEVACLSRRVT
ncbi:unnamed protein product [Arabis nemorensis]|uniref:Secreted protein n=1 Tax=Arabis nemorensis TaxID=586526 RepID=A0A565BSE4_9BRAS|nr:unnamed protein product [Arabis nemorensis]